MFIYAAAAYILQITMAAACPCIY